MFVSSSSIKQGLPVPSKNILSASSCAMPPVDSDEDEDEDEDEDIDPLAESDEDEDIDPPSK